MVLRFKKASRAFLAVAVSCSFTVTSAQTNAGSFKGEPFSVVYSATQGRALVGYLDAAGKVASFADCNVPRGEPSSRLDLIELNGCLDIPEASFLYTEDNVAKINAVFPGVLQQVFSESYNREAAGANVPNILAFGALATGGAVLLGRGIQDVSRSRAAGSRLQALKGALGGVLGGGLTLLSGVITYYSIKNSIGFASVPSIESKIIEGYRSALIKDEKLKLVLQSDKNFSLGYDVLRTAIVASVAKLTEI